MASHGGTPSMTGGHNASSDAAAAAAQARLVRIAQQLTANRKISKFYGISIASVVLLFALFHWIRFLYTRYSSTNTKTSGLMRIQVSVTRLIRNVLVRRVPGFTSFGHALLVAIYLAINLSITLTNVQVSASNLLPVAKRLGWVAALNAAFITLLALKNTPLAFLTAYSYERLNPLHQVGGYITVIATFLHLIFMCVAWSRRNMIEILIESEQIPGIIAGCAALIIIISVFTVKSSRYELFYVTHIIMYLLFIVGLALHQRDPKHTVIAITLTSIGLWTSDRIIRACRILYYSKGNTATLTHLPCGGTRIVLSRCPSRAVPGAHCFVWIPQIRSFETHPFTIVSTSNNSLEFVVAAYDGFTSDLHDYALKHPGVSLRASVDGPYGVVPDLTKPADKIILISGGSGASFTFGTALDVLKRRGQSAKPIIHFIWTVRNQEIFTWFKSELAELNTYTNVNITLHSTLLPLPTIISSSSTTDSEPSSPVVNEEKPAILSDEKSSTANISPISPTTASTFNFSVDPEKGTPITSIPNSPFNVLSGRPDIKSIIQDIVTASESDERIAIVACGPEGMMNIVRDTGAACIKTDGPAVELYCEQFGW